MLQSDRGLERDRELQFRDGDNPPGAGSCSRSF
jgi:hypothetical protein